MSTSCDTVVINSQPLPTSVVCDVPIRNSHSQPISSICDISTENSLPTSSVCDAHTENCLPISSVCDVDVPTGSSQPNSSVCDTATGNSLVCDAAIGNFSVCDAATGNSQPISVCDMAIGNSQPILFCNVATGNSQPISFCDIATGNSQPIFLVCDASTGNSQPGSSVVRDIASGNSQPIASFCDTATGNSQPISPVRDIESLNSQPIYAPDVVSQNSEKQEIALDQPETNVQSMPLDDGVEEEEDQDDEFQDQDQQLSHPDIYSLMRNEDDENLHPQNSASSISYSPLENGFPLELVSAGSTTHFNHNPTTEDLPAPSKRRRILGEIQQVPTAPKKSATQIHDYIFKESNKKTEELRFVPSRGIGSSGCVITLDSSGNKNQNESGMEIRQGSAIPRTDVVHRTHAAIRIDPQTTGRLRLGLSKRIPIPPLHPNRVRRSSNEENEN